MTWEQMLVELNALVGKGGTPLVPWFNGKYVERIPYREYISGEYHSEGKQLKSDQFSKLLQRVRENPESVRETPYHLEDEIEAHMITVLSHVFAEVKERHLLDHTTKIADDQFLDVALVLAARFHDIGKPISRILKARGSKEDTESIVQYFAYDGHHVSGFNLLRSILTEDFMKKLLPDYDDTLREKTRLATLLYVYLHQRTSVPKQAVVTLREIILWASDGRISDFLDNLNLLLRADRRGSITLRTFTAEPYKDVKKFGDVPEFAYFGRSSSSHDVVLGIVDMLTRHDDIWYILPIGAPASGKSTFFKELRDGLAKYGITVGKVSYDTTRLNMYKKAFPESEDMPMNVLYEKAHTYATKHLKQMNDEYNKALAVARKKYDLVFVDNTNLTKKNKRRSLAGSSKYGLEIFFDLDIDTHVHRNLNRKQKGGKAVEESVIHQMYMLTNPPNSHENVHVIWWRQEK